LSVLAHHPEATVLVLGQPEVARDDRPGSVPVLEGEQHLGAAHHKGLEHLHRRRLDDPGRHGAISELDQRKAELRNADDATLGRAAYDERALGHGYDLRPAQTLVVVFLVHRFPLFVLVRSCSFMTRLR